MARRKKGKQVVEAKMDMTPMIDVTFQLLIFFLVATKFKELERRLDSYLPKDEGANPQQPDTPPLEPLTIKVEGTGKGADFAPRIFIGSDMVSGYNSGSPDDFWDRVRERVKAMRKQYGEEAKTVISAQDSAPWEFVALTLNACIQAKCTAISFQFFAAG